LICINYISYGTQETGGYKHELFFAQTLSNILTKNKLPNSLNIVRANHLYKGFIPFIKLLWFGFANANANINIVVGRLGLSSIIKNLFTPHKTIIVLHYHDDNDNKSLLLNCYYHCLFWLLKIMGSNKCTLVVVADYWKKYFNSKGIKNCFIIYNYFNHEHYTLFDKNNKEKLIHLGQFSWKNDKDIFLLAHKLYQQGYSCYFSTNNINDVKYSTKEYQIIYESFSDYLLRMQKSLYTLALTKINEGWNRVAHESLLCGTQVIGYKKGGLGELLEGSNAIVVNNIDEAYQSIIGGISHSINRTFLNRFSTHQVSKQFTEICNWIIAN